MLQVYLVRHGETEWNTMSRLQGQTDSPLTAKGKHQAKHVALRMKLLGITHIISSDLGRALRTSEIIAQYCSLDITVDARLRELHMGVLETRDIMTLTKTEENWRKQLIDGTEQGRIPCGESMKEMATRMYAVLNDCLELPDTSKPLLVSHGMALGCLISMVLGLEPYSKRRLRLRNCSISRIDYQDSKWLAPGWVVDTVGDISHLNVDSINESLCC